MKGWPYGSALNKDGTIKYFSPSALTTADPSTTEGCLRKYAYQYVKGLKPEQQKWQTDGIELHAQNEHYLLTGDKSQMGSLALAGLHMLPKPKTIDDRILIEHEIGGGDLSKAPVRAAGIPLAGYIDVIHWQEINPGTSDVTDALDPPGTVCVHDHKTTSSDKWIKTPKEISRTIQMTTYGMWAVKVKNAEHVRLSHGYYITKGRNTPRKVSLLVHRDEIEKRWEYVEHLAGSLVEVVKETNPDKVPANTRACDAFRGCPHRSYCSAAGYNSLASLFSDDFASALLGEPVLTVPENNNEMSLLAKLQAQTATKPDLSSEMKRLALEEVNLKYPALALTISKLEELGLGMPKLAGEAAKAYGTLKEKAGEAFEGTGELGQLDLVVEDPNLLMTIEAEAEEIVKSRRAAGVPVVTVPVPVEVPLDPFPTDAPPALAAPAEEKVAEPVSTPEAAMEVIAGDKPAAKKRGRPPKAKEPVAEEIEAKKAQILASKPKPDSPEYRATVPAEPVIEVAPATTEAETTPVTVVNIMVNNKPEEKTPDTGAINLFVDCIPSTRYESFWPYVSKVTSDMTKHFGGDDYRLCKDTDYGKWKGYLALGLRKLEIPAGNYLLDNSMNETAGVVIEVMREIVAMSGGILVKGIR